MSKREISFQKKNDAMKCLNYRNNNEWMGNMKIMNKGIKVCRKIDSVCRCVRAYTRVCVCVCVNEVVMTWMHLKK